MSTRTNSRSALRAALKQEDAALVERLAAPVATVVPAEVNAEGTASAALTPTSADAATVVPVPTQSVPEEPARTRRATTARKSKTVERPAADRAAAAEAPVAKASTPAPKKKAMSKAVEKATATVLAAPAVETAPETKKGGAKAAAAQAPTPSEKKEKAGKVIRDSFSIPASEHHQLKSLRVELGKAGRLASKSEVLRAGLKLLAERSVTEQVAVLDALPVVVKGKRSKKH